MAYVLQDSFYSGTGDEIDTPQPIGYSYDAQTFTPVSTYLLTKVGLFLRKKSSYNIPLLRLSLRATNSDGTPYGGFPPDYTSDLIYAIFNGNDIPHIWPDYTEIPFVFNASYLVEAGTKYALVYDRDGSGTGYTEWRGLQYPGYPDDPTEPGNYAGGRQYGINWDITHSTGIDLFFKCYSGTDTIETGDTMQQYELAEIWC